MDITSSLASQAYVHARPAVAPTDTKENGQATLSDFAQSFEATLRNGEDTARAAMLGKAEPHALVEALAQTELAIETAVALRNRVVEAYQEILRMPV